VRFSVPREAHRTEPWRLARGTVVKKHRNDTVNRENPRLSME